MSPKLALSSTLSVLLMAGFALSGGQGPQIDLANAGGLLPTVKAELPSSLPHCPSCLVCADGQASRVISRS